MGLVEGGYNRYKTGIICRCKHIKVGVMSLKRQLEETWRKNTIYENKYGVGVSKLSKTFVERIQIMDSVPEQK